MKKILLIFLLPTIFCAPSTDQLDEFVDLNEDEFVEHFHLTPVADPEEHAAREKALRKHEAEMKEVNEAYRLGNKTWFDAMNPFADLPDDELVAQKTGAFTPQQFGTGAFEPTGPERVDAKSEAYFDQFRHPMNRLIVPKSFSSVDEGHVSPVKDQQACGSCVAFSNMALIETCFHRITGVFGDYSEQQLLDCGYDGIFANGCRGAAIFAYVKWASHFHTHLTSESNYPYLNAQPNLQCPGNLPQYNQGAKVTGKWYTYSGNEEIMKIMVVVHGAVTTSVKAEGPFMWYGGGVFSGCAEQQQHSTDHAVTVVGYGTDRATGYIKMDYGEICSAGEALKSEAECRAAAAALGLNFEHSWDGPGDFPGCLHTKDSRNAVYFNTSPNPTTDQFNTNYAALCLPTEGMDYWLIKNSWGPDWGENGFIRLQRGVGACGIGRHIATVSCGPAYVPPIPSIQDIWKKPWWGGRSQEMAKSQN